MPRHITCDSCELKLLAFEADDPEPIGREDCPRCGARSFTFVGE